MFKLRNIYTGEIVTVYAVNNGGHFLLFGRQKPEEEPTWYWADWEEFEPVEV